MTKLQVGDAVIISSNLKKTDEAHTVVSEMRKMIGNIYKIEKIRKSTIGRPSTIFIDAFMFHPDDLIPYKKPKKQKPVTFNPENLNL